jgi:ATP-dependent DNA helicase RecQ
MNLEKHSDEMENILRERFQMSSFRLGQKEIISSILNGQDTIAILPTGGGKSLCYQYPALFKNQLVIVVSPLIALMNDQVEGLKNKGIPAGCVHSDQNEEQKRALFLRLKEGGAFILYLSPERTQKEGFLNWIKNLPIALFAIDEAHCVSMWGHDFREEYAQLHKLKEIRPDVPMLALTASATPFVIRDIAKQLTLKSPAKHVHGFYRPNLYYQVESCADDFEKIQLLKQAIAKNPQGRVIIYCGTRSKTEELAALLSTEFDEVDFYHAGMSGDLRQQKQDDYSQGKTRILLATNAFGMGIDHPDVRLVVHYQMPANIDSLYQEMGRAGRDGRMSTCLLLYAKKDKGLQSFFIQSSKASSAIQTSRWRALDNLVSYAEGGECRHAEILTYYQDAQRIEKCGHCDVCDPSSLLRIQVLRPAKKLPEASAAVPKPLSKKKKSELENQELSAEETRVFQILKIWRKDKAKELDVPAFVIFSDKTLRHLAKVQPTELEEFKKIYGMGEVKIERFGPELLSGPLSS